MKKNSNSISVKILGKDYTVTCPSGNEAKLVDAANYLNDKMSNIRRQGRVIGLERIAVMAALNIAHEYLNSSNANKDATKRLETGLINLQNSLNKILTPKKASKELAEEIITL